MPSWTLAALRRQGREATERNAATYALAVDTGGGHRARMEGRANLCGEVGAITVEAGEDVGAGSAALNILST
jgi:hypothetical protein